jgi:acyl-CoA synthetase (AMP-forming)/AMP-acid ligase II
VGISGPLVARALAALDELRAVLGADALAPLVTDRGDPDALEHVIISGGYNIWPAELENRDKVGAVKRVRAVEFVDDLPRSAIGNVLRREVRMRHGG